jgi:hypothetical protein
MNRASPSDPLAQTPGEIADVLKRSRPSDFDGHTDFQRLTPAQRLDWLAQAATFVYELKGTAHRRA